MWKDDRDDTALLEAARQFNKNGIVYGNGNALDEMESFERLIEKQKRLLKKSKGEVPLSDEKRLKLELKELEKARRDMVEAAEKQALLASAKLAEQPRVRGENGVPDLDGEICKMFRDWAEVPLNGATGRGRLKDTTQGMRIMQKQYEGGAPQSPHRTSVSKID